MLQNRDVFLRDPFEFAILNDGRTTVLNPSTQEQWDVLRYELRNFVCEGEYREGLFRILSTYLDHLGRPVQPAVWVSGFYGSGKSHLVRTLEFLWRNVTFSDGVTARGLVDLPSDVAELFTALDESGAEGGGLWSAGGNLSKTSGSIRLALLNILFENAGLPLNYPTAKFVIWLKQHDRYETLRDRIERSGESFAQEVKALYVSPVLTENLLAVYPSLAASPAELRQMLRQQFPLKEEISDSEMLETMEDILRLQSSRSGMIPKTLLVFDELQQTIADDPTRTLQVQNIVEACSTRFGSNLLFIATGQSALESNSNLSKLKDRFTVRVDLSDKDVEQVVREVVLRKQPSRVDDVRQVLETARGEIDRQLAGSKIGPTGADAADLVSDYPLLPARRRFWERALRAIDSAGTSAQLRTQLRIVHEATRQVATDPLGTVVPGDVVYEQQKSAMLQNGVLLREIDVVIQEQDDGTPEGKLRSRLCAAVFLVNQLPEQGVMTTGLTAAPNTLVDLLVSDLTGRGPGGRNALAQQVPLLLEGLTEAGVLMQVEGEYRLQTRESAEWQQEFRLHVNKIVDSAGLIETKRNDAFQVALNEQLKNIRLTQGESKVPRKLSYNYFTQERPGTDSASVPIWVQSGWDTSEKRLREEAQAAGIDSPIVFLFIPRLEADALKEALARREAAKMVLNARPSNPSAPDAIEARSAMETRQKLANSEVNRLLLSVLESARVYQGGGGEISGETLAQSVEQATENALVRLFPNFTAEADDPRWAAVIRRASEGNSDALSALGYNGDTAQHPICREILSAIGSGGQRGGDVQKRFTGAGYGWPKDTVDGALMALLADNRMLATKNGQSVGIKGLSQGQLGVLDFVAEDITISTGQRIQIRRFLSDMGLGQINSGEEIKGILRLLSNLKESAIEASGEPPLPPKMSTETIDVLQARQGNALLAGLFDSRVELEEFQAECQRRKDLISLRRPKWGLLLRLLEQAGDLPVAAEIQQQVDAIRRERSLVSDPDPITPLSAQLTDALREAAHAAKQKMDEAREREVAALSETTEWTALPDNTWQSILHGQGLGPAPEPDVSTDEKLLAALTQRPLKVWDSEAAAMPTRLQKAREVAAKKLNPESIRVQLPSATLKTEEELDKYVARLRAEVLKHIKQGHPVII